MMTHKQIIAQLQTLIEDAESHRNAGGTLDEVFQNDIEALTAAIVECKRAAARAFCDTRACGDCPMNRKTCLFSEMDADEPDDALETIGEALV